MGAGFVFPILSFRWPRIPYERVGEWWNYITLVEPLGLLTQLVDEAWKPWMIWSFGLFAMGFWTPLWVPNWPPFHLFQKALILIHLGASMQAQWFYIWNRHSREFGFPKIPFNSFRNSQCSCLLTILPLFDVNSHIRYPSISIHIPRCIALSLLGCLLCGLGFLNFESNSDAQELWVDQHSQQMKMPGLGAATGSLPRWLIGLGPKSTFELLDLGISWSWFQ